MVALALAVLGSWLWASSAAAETLVSEVAIAAGATQRVVEYGSSAGLRRLDTGFVPALELRLRAGVSGGQWSFGGQLVYGSSVGVDALQEGRDSARSTTPLRTHRFQVGVLPEYRFSASPDAVSLGLFVGYALRALASDAELRIPRYTLHGPVLRPVLSIPFGGVSLRIAPELQSVISISRDLRSSGDLEAGGFALGVEGTFGVHAGEWLVIEASYRESHAFAGSSWETSFSDVERFALAGLRAEFF